MAHDWSKSSRKQAGLSLVELLVVVFVIGILLSLLLPAIHSVRQTSQLATCRNNLRQIGLAIHQHHDSQGHFPTGGWGHEWVGIPGRGFGLNQPGGWMYNILPFLEMDALHEMGSNLEVEAMKKSSVQRLITPVSLFNCPSRRECKAWPTVDHMPHLRAPKISGSVFEVARADYAINSGDQIPYYFPGPPNLDYPSNFSWPDTQSFTGVSFLRSRIKLAQVGDGASHTYLVGEKYLNSSNYFTGKDPGDNESLYVGYCADTHRFAQDRTPLQDQRDLVDPYRFGSAHSMSCNFLFCDGSVHKVSYDIDSVTHARLANRQDGLYVDGLEK